MDLGAELRDRNVMSVGKEVLGTKEILPVVHREPPYQCRAKTSNIG